MFLACSTRTMAGARQIVREAPEPRYAPPRLVEARKPVRVAPCRPTPSQRPILTPSDKVRRVIDLVARMDKVSRHLAERIKEQLDSPSPIELISYEEAYEVGFEDMERRRPSIAKVHDAIGWKPELGLDDIIQSVAADMGTRRDG